MSFNNKSTATIGSLEHSDNCSWRAYATGSDGLKLGPWQPSKKEALADLSNARVGVANSTDVAGSSPEVSPLRSELLQAV